MRIGELAERTATPPHLLRYYEHRGLLTPARSASGYRNYTRADVDRVRYIRQLIGAGLSTAVIAEVLPCLTAVNGTLAPLCPETRAIIDREHTRIAALIEKLAGSRQLLHAILEQNPANGQTRRRQAGQPP